MAFKAVIPCQEFILNMNNDVWGVLFITYNTLTVNNIYVNFFHHAVSESAVNKGKDWGPTQFENEKGSDLGCVVDAFQMLGL